MNRRELRKAMAAARKDARRRVAALPAVQAARARRRRRQLTFLAVVAVLVLACLSRCQCEAGPQVAPKVGAREPSPPPLAAAKVPPPPPLVAKVRTQPRPPLATGLRETPSWLDEYRLQVAARSGKLAECFNGTDQPGALRWTATVTPESGRVSEHELEPVGVASVPPGAQACLLRALSTPPYRLAGDAGVALSPRVTLLLEF